MKYICKRCGKEFEAKHKTLVCPDCQYTNCIVCGKRFRLKSPYTAVTCSSKCRGIYRRESGEGKEIAKRAHETAKENGSLNVSKDVKICELCGKEFIPVSNRQKYCKGVHYAPCPVCGKMTPIKDYDRGVQCCSERCRLQRIKNTVKERYNTENVFQVEEVKEKARETCNKKYGKEYYAQTEEFKERYEEQNLEKYGVEYPLQDGEVKEKARETCRQKWGTDYPTQNGEVKERVRKSNEERYGGTGFASNKTKVKIQKTMEEKWGDKCAARVPELKEKARKTNLEKWGVENWAKSEARLQYITDPSKADEFKKLKENPKEYIVKNFTEKPTRTQIAKRTGVAVTTIDAIINGDKELQEITVYKQSTMENEVYEFLISLDNKTEIRKRDRQIIAPQELDFYLPEYALGIECNPTYTHNSSIGGYNNEPKAPSYHREKSIQCLEKGISLFHIYGYEWTARREIIESMIRNRMGKNTRRVSARDCYVTELTQKELDLFLEVNHRQGTTTAKTRLGLKTNEKDEVVAVMSFSKMRRTMGDREEDENTNTVELTRFCSLLNTTVNGGASKLFNYFIKNYEFDKIVSFSDISHTGGGIYRELGFREVSKTRPTYRWVNLETDEAINRVRCQKRNLRKLFSDKSIDIENQTESEIMEQHGYVKVYDSGLTRWEYTRDAEICDICGF